MNLSSRFSDLELEAVFEDQVNTWSEYQTNVALRAIHQNENADLVMVYSEQPDASEHQFLLVDPRQATNPQDPSSILGHQDPKKIRRYETYVRNAYQAANRLVQAVISSTGIDQRGLPNSDIIVVSDHGFDPFHTTVNLNGLLAQAGIDPNKSKP